MKLRSIRVALLSAFALASAALSFAGDQPGKMHMLSKSQMQDRTGMTPAVQQGKGAGMTRSQVVLRGDTDRSDTAADRPALPPAEDSFADPQPTSSDTAFRK